MYIKIYHLGIVIADINLDVANIVINKVIYYRFLSLLTFLYCVTIGDREFTRIDN